MPRGTPQSDRKLEAQRRERETEKRYREREQEELIERSETLKQEATEALSAREQAEVEGGLDKSSSG